MLDRNHLMILQAVEQQGSLTAAADALCLTQSALSHSIKKLEQRLDTPIWVKEGRKVRLSPAGNYLLALAERLLPQFELAESQIKQMVQGERGTLRIGMECHPCYQWLLNVVNPFLQTWTDVELDVKQKFKFAGVGALFNYEIDILITPDPYLSNDLYFEPVFPYEQVLVVASHHPFATQAFVTPEQLADQTLYTYPVEKARLDVYSDFLLPAHCHPAKHKTVETTDIMLQLVLAGRGVAALPEWLVKQYTREMAITPVRLGEHGIQKSIYVGLRESDLTIDYIKDFIETAKQSSPY